MTEIRIVGNFDLPEGITLGDNLKIDGYIQVYELRQARVDVTGLGAQEPEHILGDTTLETTIRDPFTITKPEDPYDLLGHSEIT